MGTQRKQSSENPVPVEAPRVCITCGDQDLFSKYFCVRNYQEHFESDLAILKEERKVQKMKRLLTAALIIFAFSGVAIAGEIQFNKSGKMTSVSDTNPLPVDAEVSVGSISVSVDPAFKTSGGVATSAVLTATGRVPVDAGTISTTPSFVDNAGVATSSPLYDGKVHTYQAPLGVSTVSHYAGQVGTGAVTLISTLAGGMNNNSSYLIQCRSGTIYIGGSTEAYTDIKNGGHKLEAGEALPIFRCGAVDMDLGLVADTSVATVSITIFVESN